MKALGRFSLFLTPSIVQGAISLLMLPVATRVLGPHDYGAFALVGAFTAFGPALASLGGGYVLANRLNAQADAKSEAAAVTTVVVFAQLAVVVYAALLTLIWTFVPERSEISTTHFALAVAAMVIGQPWIPATDVLVLRGNARLFASTTIAQSLLSAATLLYGLFVLELGVGALFLAQLAASVAGLAGASYGLGPYLIASVDRAVLRELKDVGLMSGLGNIAEALQNAVERNLLAAVVGLAQLGVYTHSQLYRTITALVVKAVARSVWPITLQDAREPTGDFRRTRIAWDMANVGITLAGIFFACVGDVAIGLLTNDKFTDAYALAVAWIAYLLVVNLGKPQTGVLFALGGGATYARIVTIGNAIGIAALVALVPPFATWGALAAIILQQIAIRALVQRASRAIRPTPVQDGWAYFGVAYIIGVFACRQLLGGPSEVNLGIFAVSGALLLFVARKRLTLAARVLLRAG